MIRLIPSYSDSLQLTYQRDFQYFPHHHYKHKTHHDDCHPQQKKQQALLPCCSTV
jgi:hypothetical protein